jgi:hypothetical protein
MSKRRFKEKTAGCDDGPGLKNLTTGYFGHKVFPFPIKVVRVAKLPVPKSTPGRSTRACGTADLPGKKI